MTRLTHLLWSVQDEISLASHSPANEMVMAKTIQPLWTGSSLEGIRIYEIWHGIDCRRFRNLGSLLGVTMGFSVQYSTWPTYERGKQMNVFGLFTMTEWYRFPPWYFRIWLLIQSQKWNEEALMLSTPHDVRKLNHRNSARYIADRSWVSIFIAVVPSDIVSIFSPSTFEMVYKNM